MWEIPAESVGWVERSATHHGFAWWRADGGLRFAVTHRTQLRENVAIRDLLTGRMGAL